MAKLRGTEKTVNKENKSANKTLPSVKSKRDAGTKSTDKVSSTPKISKNSKTISKSNKPSGTTIAKRKLREVSWLKGLLDGRSYQTKKTRILKSGISAHTSTSLTLRSANGVDYAMFPWHRNRSSGYIKMEPRGVKTVTKSQSTMHFVVLFGKMQLLANNTATNFESGSLITIPTGIHYGLKNHTSDTTYLRYQSIVE